MPDPRLPTHLRSRLRLLVLLAVAACASATGALAALRIEARGIEPFVLEATGVEDSTAWYDAEEWLRHFPGATTWDAENGRLSYREGDHWISLRAQAPYALRNGLPLEDAPSLRRAGDRLLVSESFLRRSAEELLDRWVRVLPAGDQIRHRVVIDAGHGGGEEGSRGDATATPVVEKTVVLDLVLEAAERLREAGFAVHLTRSGDHAISAEKRAAVANYWGAELFISIHAAGQGRPQARGFEVFVAPPAGAGLDVQRWEAGQSGQAEASRRWALAVQAALGRFLATFDRGISVAPSPLLEAVACPAVLVEVGTLAWPGDAEALTTEVGRKRIAAALVAAAQDYFSDSSP
jgi:N-acetylmuramoyl-L-alanine amidase